MKKKIKKLSNKFLKLFGYKFSRITCLNDESMRLFTLLNYLNVDTLSTLDLMKDNLSKV